MVRGGMSVYDNNDWRFAKPFIYSSNRWQLTTPYIYNENNWQIIQDAGTLMIPFITNDNKDFITSDEKNFLVRNTEPNTTFTSLIIVEQPIKTTYEVGDMFDPTGIKVMATYTNTWTTSSFDVPFTFLNYSMAPIALTDTYRDLSFTHNGITKSVRVNFTVAEPLVSISIQNPTEIRTNYLQSEHFDPSGLIVIAHYTNHDEQVYDYIYTPTRGLNISDTEITIKYKGLSTSLPITVNSAEVDLPLTADYWGGWYTDTGWSGSSWNYGSRSFDTNGIIMSIGYHPTSGGGGSARYWTTNTVDFTNISSITCKVSRSNKGSFTIVLSPTTNVSDSVLSYSILSGVTNFTLDLSNISGSYYIIVGGSSELNSDVSLRISEMTMTQERGV